MFATVSTVPECAPFPRRMLFANMAGVTRMTLILPMDAVCVDMAERWRQLRETGQQEKTRLDDRMANGGAEKWERLCHRWASKHRATAHGA